MSKPPVAAVALVTFGSRRQNGNTKNAKTLQTQRLSEPLRGAGLGCDWGSEVGRLEQVRSLCCRGAGSWRHRQSLLWRSGSGFRQVSAKIVPSGVVFGGVSV